MPTIDELLNNLNIGDESQEKVAHLENDVEKAAQDLGLISNEGTTKIASPNDGGEKMDLQSFYDMHFDNAVVGGSEKTASHNDMEKEASALEGAGEYAGHSFNSFLGERLFKFAMDEAFDGVATQEAQKGPGVIPGAATSNPQLPVNAREDREKGMDTSPQHYDLLDKAVAKKILEAALENGNPGELSHKTLQVDTGLAMPKNQTDA